MVSGVEVQVLVAEDQLQDGVLVDAVAVEEVVEDPGEFRHFYVTKKLSSLANQQEENGEMKYGKNDGA